MTAIQFALIIVFFSFSYGVTTTASASHWAHKDAETICKTLEQATTDYQQGNTQHARRAMTAAYFQQYDKTLEPISRQTFGTPHVFDIEQRFNTLRKAMTKPYSSAQRKNIQQQQQQLCKQLRTDAKLLADEAPQRTTGDDK